MGGGGEDNGEEMGKCSGRFEAKKKIKKKKAPEEDWRKADASDDGEEGDGGDWWKVAVRKMGRRWVRAQKGLKLTKKKRKHLRKIGEERPMPMMMERKATVKTGGRWQQREWEGGARGLGKVQSKKKSAPKGDWRRKADAGEMEAFVSV
ncbi:hypothetical protein COCNU_scaffold029945G000010 [Cocos nucifera]|nr:hypothetical protein [Cocos nucifera]